MQKYDDRWKNFLKRTLNKVEYLKNAKVAVLEELVYELKLNFYDIGDYMFTPGQTKDSLMFLAHGKAEVSFTFNDRNLFKH